MEHSVPALPTAQTQSLWKEAFLLTEQEILHSLQMTDERRAGKGRIIVESVVLGAAGLYFLIGYLTSDMQNTTPLVMLLLCAFVLVMLIFAPQLQARNLARRAAAKQQTVTLQGYDGALGFGEGENFSACTFDEFSAVGDETMLVLRFRAGQLVVIPRRAVADSTWRWLCDALPIDSCEGGAKS